MIASKLNSASARLLESCIQNAANLRIETHSVVDAAIVDFGVKSAGGLEAGLQLARICMAGLGQVELQAGATDALGPEIVVRTDHPISACLQSQYAGWKIATDDYFAMGSGPMRAAAAMEEIFDEFPADKATDECVGVLESGSLPTVSAIKQMQTSLQPNQRLLLAVAPTASQAGNIQVVARSVETAMHKLHEIGFPLETVVSGFGSSPLPPVAQDDLKGIGRTNDAILYGAVVNLWVECDDDVLEEFGPRTPSNSSASHGQKFLALFKAANHDFYALDKSLFSPAVVVFHNIRSGNSFRYGTRVPELLKESFGL